MNQKLQLEREQRKLDRYNLITARAQHKRWARNSRLNYKPFKRRVYNRINDLKQVVNPESIALVIGSGPYLNKLLPWMENPANLAMIHEKCTIFCVDTAYPAVAHKLHPDYCVTIDPADLVADIFPDEQQRVCPLIASHTSAPKGLNEWMNTEIGNDPIYMYRLFHPTVKCLNATGKQFKQANPVVSIGNVVNFTINMVIYYFGFKQVAVAGFDLSYPNRETKYVDGVKHEPVTRKHNPSDAIQLNNCGKPVWSDEVFRMYAQNFTQLYKNSYQGKADIMILGQSIVPLPDRFEQFKKLIGGE